MGRFNVANSNSPKVKYIYLILARSKIWPESKRSPNKGQEEARSEMQHFLLAVMHFRMRTKTDMQLSVLNRSTYLNAPSAPLAALHRWGTRFYHKKSNNCRYKAILTFNICLNTKTGSLYYKL